MIKIFKVCGIIFITLFVIILISLFCSLFTNRIVQLLSFLICMPVGSIAGFLIMGVLSNDT